MEAGPAPVSGVETVVTTRTGLRDLGRGSGFRKRSEENTGDGVDRMDDCPQNQKAIKRLEPIHPRAKNLDRTVCNHMADRAQETTPFGLVVMPAVQGIESNRCHKSDQREPARPSPLPEREEDQAKSIMQQGNAISWLAHCQDFTSVILQGPSCHINRTHVCLDSCGLDGDAMRVALLYAPPMQEPLSILNPPYPSRNRM